MPERVKDQRHYQPAAPELEREFPGWAVVRRGKLWHASYGVHEAIGEDTDELREAIIAAKHRLGMWNVQPK